MHLDRIQRDICRRADGKQVIGTSAPIRSNPLVAMGTLRSRKIKVK
jgi:hypothetical protein